MFEGGRGKERVEVDDQNAVYRCVKLSKRKFISEIPKKHLI